MIEIIITRKSFTKKGFNENIEKNNIQLVEEEKSDNPNGAIQLRVYKETESLQNISTLLFLQNI